MIVVNLVANSAAVSGDPTWTCTQKDRRTASAETIERRSSANNSVVPSGERNYSKTEAPDLRVIEGKFHDKRDFWVFLQELSLVTRTRFSAQCTLVQMRGLGIACRPSVCPSVRL